MRSTQGDARNSPQHPITQQHVPSPLVQPVGAVREPPLPPPSPKHPHPQQRVPSPASHSPPPPRGRLRGGPRVRATGRPWGAATTQTTNLHHSPQHPTPKTESSACFPICTPIQNKALYQHIYGTSQLYFPLSLDSYRAVVLAFSLYKLVSDRRIWTPIKPKLDEGIQELR